MNESTELVPMPPKLLQVLSSEAKDTKEIILRSNSSMVQRKQDAKEYYEPAERLNESIQITRQRFKQKEEEAMRLILHETEQLRQIQQINENSLIELRKSTDYLNNSSLETNDSPINLAVRSIASLFPFVTFAILAFCTR
ncbi:hypothetical protein M9Y10_029034 [Tritrichomonas musculus]|uniref:Uncharacterized protein n=1 Tax=Tritrichomonas musculus TaxID=1915356 RepID=A0ABR2KLW0_9EUKA